MKLSQYILDCFEIKREKHCCGYIEDVYDKLQNTSSKMCGQYIPSQYKKTYAYRMDHIGNYVPLGGLSLPASILASPKGDDGSSLKKNISLLQRSPLTKYHTNDESFIEVDAVFSSYIILYYIIVRYEDMTYYKIKSSRGLALRTSNCNLLYLT